jgi:hypothetical protein
MNLCSRAVLFLAANFVLLFVVPTVFGDEGMWLFNNPPRKLLKDKYKFNATDKWLEHLQKSSVRCNVGGSGSFVSADGLVMTNHHVGSDAIQKIGAKEMKDYLKEGFHAKTLADEKKCEGEEFNVLMSIDDVTDKVNAAVTPDLSPEKAEAARRQVMADIQKEALKDLDPKRFGVQIVTLYQGGAYHLYHFKKYTDIRLVFAPEQQAAFYGGDPDNFEYPRFDFDISLFRVYEDGKPAHIEHYLKWSKAGAKDDELIFVSGHPGRTSRLSTPDELANLRDTIYPYTQMRLNRLEVLLTTYGGRTEKNAEQAKEDLFSVQNSRKAYIGMMGGLLDPDLMERKKAEHHRFQEEAKKNEKLKAARNAWERIAAAEKVRAETLKPYAMLERGGGFNCELFTYARTLLRAGDERAKPNGERLREYSETNLASLEHALLSPDTIFPQYEVAKLTDSLTLLTAQLGYKTPLVQKVLAGKAPHDRAFELVSGCKLADATERERLFKGGKDEVAKSKDPMIELARIVDEDARKVRKKVETEVDEVKRQAYGDITKVKFALEGTNTYPDATFTLRLAFGVVKGYEEDKKPIPFETTFAGLYERSAEHHDQAPFDLPKIWVKNKDKLDLKTPFNFVCTADIIGGNSGSPVVNRDAEVVGLIFDGNIQSLVLDFEFTEKQARAVAVHSQGIIEALRKIYGANDLADELTTGKRK